MWPETPNRASDRKLNACEVNYHRTSVDPARFLQCSTVSKYRGKYSDDLNTEQVLEMSKQQQTKKEVKEMAIPISLGGGGAKQAKSPRPRFLPFDFKMPSGDELMAQVQAQMAEMQQATSQQVQAMTQQAETLQVGLHHD